MPRYTNKYGDKLKTLYVETPAEDLDKLDKLVALARTNRSVYIRRLIHEHVNQVQANEEPETT